MRWNFGSLYMQLVGRGTLPLAAKPRNANNNVDSTMAGHESKAVAGMSDIIWGREAQKAGRAVESAPECPRGAGGS